MDIICMPECYRVFLDGEYLDVPYEYVNAPRTLEPCEYVSYLMEVENMSYRDVIFFLIEHAPMKLY